MEDVQKKKVSKTLYIVLIIILVIINGALFWYGQERKKKDRERYAKLELAKKEVDSLLELKIGELNNMMELDSINQEAISDLLVRLNNARDSIRNLDASLEKQRRDNGYLYSQLGKYKKIADAVELEKGDIMRERDSVIQVANLLRRDLDTMTIRYDNALAQAAEMEEQRDSVIDIGTILDMESLTATGVRNKNNGKEIGDQKASKTQKIKICFELLENRLIESESQLVKLKLTNEKGVTLTSDNHTGGREVNRETGDEYQFSSKLPVKYNKNQRQSYCFYWTQTGEYAAGKYKAELFHKGYPIGDLEFTLK